MPVIASYDARTINARNPLARFAHRSRMARGLDLVAQRTPEGGLVVDFGAGSGAFLQTLQAERPDIEALAVEPIQPANSALRYVASLGEVPAGSVDVVTAFEVCEHLDDETLDAFLADTARVLKPGGALVISVPIMLGAAIVPKELNRRVFGRYAAEYTAGELLRATFGLSTPRAAQRLWSHKGFDFRWLRGRVAARLAVRQAIYSPLPALPWFLNSQAFYVATAQT